MSFQEVEKIQRAAHKQRILEAKLRKQQMKLNPVVIKRLVKKKREKTEEDEDYDEEKDEDEEEEEYEEISVEGTEEDEEDEDDELTSAKFDFRDEWIL
jgi:DNA-directed RNA polymerase delta subunit